MRETAELRGGGDLLGELATIGTAIVGLAIIATLVPQAELAAIKAQADGRARRRAPEEYAKAWDNRRRTYGPAGCEPQAKLELIKPPTRELTKKKPRYSERVYWTKNLGLGADTWMARPGGDLIPAREPLHVRDVVAAILEAREASE